MYGTVHTLCFSRPYLEFADDLALLAHSFNNVQVFGGPACSVRLRINIDKSKIMKVTTDRLLASDKISNGRRSQYWNR